MDTHTKKDTNTSERYGHVSNQTIVLLSRQNGMKNISMINYELHIIYNPSTISHLNLFRQQGFIWVEIMIPFGKWLSNQNIVHEQWHVSLFDYLSIITVPSSPKLSLIIRQPFSSTFQLLSWVACTILLIIYFYFSTLKLWVKLSELSSFSIRASYFSIPDFKIDFWLFVNSSISPISVNALFAYAIFFFESQFCPISMNPCDLPKQAKELFFGSFAIPISNIFNPSTYLSCLFKVYPYWQYIELYLSFFNRALSKHFSACLYSPTKVYAFPSRKCGYYFSGAYFIAFFENQIAE